MSKRSAVLVVIGVVVFVLGAGLVLVSVRADKGGSGKGGSGTKADETAAGAVVVVTADVPAGTSGQSLITTKQVALEAVPARKLSPDDITSIASLAGVSLSRDLSAGSPVQASDLTTDSGPLTTPAGDESMALTVSGGANDLAGYLQPGSKVDIYTNIVKSGTQTTDTPCVELVQPDVEVLDVSDVVPPYRSDPTAGGRAVPSSLTLLVAVSPSEVPRVVYFADNGQQLYLVASDGTTVGPSGTCYHLDPASSTQAVPAS